jgi:cysteine-rich repeat protein
MRLYPQLFRQFLPGALVAWSCFALVACGDDSNPGTTAAGATGMGGAGGASSSSSASSGGGGMGGAGLLCGNGVVDAPETCDDGNHASGDGCSAFCIEEGPIVDLQANADRSCVIGQGGTLRCWGHGEIGELG